MLASQGGALVQTVTRSPARSEEISPMQHTTTRALLFTLASRRSMYMLTTALFMGPFAAAQAQSLVPDMPSVEVHLDALESLRVTPNFPPPAPPSGAFAAQSAPRSRPQPVAPAQRQVPVDNRQQMKPAAQPAAAARNAVLPPPPVKKAAPPAVQPKPAAVPPKKAAAPVSPEVVKPVAAPASPLPKPEPQPVTPAQKTAALPAAAVPVKDAPKAPAPLLDFGKLGTPQPDAAPAVSAPAPAPVNADVEAMLKSLDAANQPKAPAAAGETFPVLAPLPAAPSVLPAPQGAKAVSDDVLVAAKPVDSVPAPALPPLETPKEDASLKNLSDRMNHLFVKEPEQQGIISDKTAKTGALQNMPPKPPAVAALPAVAAPAPVSNATPPKPGSVLDKLAQGAKAAPTIPGKEPAAFEPLAALPEKTVAPVLAEKTTPALPELPALPPARSTVQKPEQMTLKQVNATSPAASMSVPAKPVVPPAPLKAEPKAEVKAVAPAIAIPQPVIAAVNAPASAAQPSLAPKESLKPGTMGALPPLPVLAKPAAPTPELPAPVVAGKATIASADSLADLLPPPGTSAAVVKPVVAPVKELPSTLPALPKLDDLAAAPKSSLPSLSALTGEGKSSMDIALDKEGVRTNELAPLVAATAANTLPSLAENKELPKVTHGKPTPVIAPPKPVVADEKPKPSAAVATPDKPASVQLASTSVPATPGAATPATVARAVALPAEAGKPVLSVTFDADKSDVELDMQSKIAGIADQAKKGSSVLVLAYATGKPEENSVARRISLSRALQVRAKLIEKGVDAQKITVQALGNSKPGMGDKADIIVK